MKNLKVSLRKLYNYVIYVNIFTSKISSKRNFGRVENRVRKPSNISSGITHFFFYVPPLAVCTFFHVPHHTAREHGERGCISHCGYPRYVAVPVGGAVCMKSAPNPADAKAVNPWL